MVQNANSQFLKPITADTTVSVVIPVYNRIDSLKSAIESVFCQTRPADEIIVVDDGSDMDIQSAIAAYLGRVKLVCHDQNLGVSAARNTGVLAATGELIAFLDSDDVWMPFKLKLQSEFMIEQQVLVSHTDEFWWKNGTFVNQGKNHTKYGGDIFCDILDICRLSPSSAMIHRSVFDTVGGFNPHLKACEDYDLWIRLALQYDVGYLDVPSIVKRAFLDDHLSANISHLESLRLMALGQLLTHKNRFTYQQLKCAYIELDRKFNIVINGLKKSP